MFPFHKHPAKAIGLALAALGGLTAACTGMAQHRTQDESSADTTVTTISNSGSGTNRITVTGNSANHVEVDCSNGVARADVNSVNIDGARMQGKTVIVTGRNSKNVTVRGNCDRKDASGSVNVNSVTIR